MAQRVEKVAQRRLEERNEKIKSARKTRFDIRLNPFFSRPIGSIAKEFVRQQQNEPEKVHNSSKHPIILSQSPEDITAYTFVNNSYKEPSKSIKKNNKESKKLHYSIDDDDDESGSPKASTISESSSPSVSIKRSLIKSGSTRSATSTTDAIMIRSINALKLIFPSDHKTKYQPLFLVDNLAYIYIQLVVTPGYKTMTGAQFRNFAK